MKNTVIWLLFGMLVISNAVLALLLITDESSDRAQAQSTPTEVATQTPLDEEASLGVVSERYEYAAQAADFSLSLGGEYRIVVENDEGSGKLRSTKLRIGRGSSSLPNAVQAAANDYVKVEAYPSSSNGTRDQFVNNDTALQGNFADESASSVDGVQARRFELEGVGKTVKYYFERQGLVYFIEAWDVSSGDTQIMLDDVLRGFNFN